MKMRRANAILLMVFLLQEKGFFTRDEIIQQTGLAASSFFLALSDFRCFLVEFRPFFELEFSKGEDAYRLKEMKLEG